MYIEEVCVDGFKSYAQRVTLPGFDKHFNAITGLNGSGKVGKVSLCCSYNRDDAEHNPNTTTPLCPYLLISYCIVL